MPRNPENRRVEILLSPAQFQALTREMESRKATDIAEFVRRTLLQVYPSMPDDLHARGKYKRSEDNAK